MVSVVCHVAALRIVDIGGWSREAIELIEDVTMCAKWEPVMTKIIKKSDPPLVAIVNTSNNQVSVLLMYYTTVTMGTGH